MNGPHEEAGRATYEQYCHQLLRRETWSSAQPCCAEQLARLAQRSAGRARTQRRTAWSCPCTPRRQRTAGAQSVTATSARRPAGNAVEHHAAVGRAQAEHPGARHRDRAPSHRWHPVLMAPISRCGAWLRTVALRARGGLPQPGRAVPGSDRAPDPAQIRSTHRALRQCFPSRLFPRRLRHGGIRRLFAGGPPMCSSPRPRQPRRRRCVVTWGAPTRSSSIPTTAPSSAPCASYRAQRCTCWGSPRPSPPALRRGGNRRGLLDEGAIIQPIFCAASTSSSIANAAFFGRAAASCAGDGLHPAGHRPSPETTAQPN